MSSIDTSQRINEKGFQNTSYPSLTIHKEDIFIVVKTYPLPSPSYREIVCTAGITTSGRWIRLYPIDYRYMTFYKRYSKYQWVSVNIQKNLKDRRIDSYRPDLNTLKPISNVVDSSNGWKRRKEIVFPTVSRSLCQMVARYKKYRISLGMIKPKKIIDLKIEKTSEKWSTKHQRVLSQLRLFGQQPKQLDKVPFKFSYIFTCDDESCSKNHTLSIIDWEIFALYLNLKNKYGYSMDKVLEKVKEKWFGEMCRIDKATHLILGSRYPTPTFMVLGVFWPPKPEK